MDILVLILFAVILFWSSNNQSKKAKQQRERRMASQGKQPAPATQTKSARPNPTATASKKGTSAPPRPGKTSKVPPSPKSGKTPQSAKRPKTSPAARQTDVAMAQRTLIEQRPEREQRENYTKVAASVKPLKNAYENDEHCEHRIELNPEIQYSSQRKKQVAAAKVKVRTDGEGLVQGIIWSEILGKPKAYQSRTPRFHR